MVESNCQHFGVTGVRWKTGIFTRSRMLGIPLRGGRGRWLCVLFVRNEHLRWTYPRAGQQGSTQSRPVTSKGSYLCESAKDAICLHKQQELTYLRLTTYVGLYRRSDRESNKFTTDNTGDNTIYLGMSLALKESLAFHQQDTSLCLCATSCCINTRKGITKRICQGHKLNL